MLPAHDRLRRFLKAAREQGEPRPVPARHDRNSPLLGPRAFL